MELTLLGTGCPQCDVRRFGPANLVRHAGLSLLVDCGSGGTQRLLAAQSSGRDGDAVVYDNEMGAAEDAETTTVLGGGSIVIHKN